MYSFTFQTNGGTKMSFQQLNIPKSQGFVRMNFQICTFPEYNDVIDITYVNWQKKHHMIVICD